MSDSPGEIAEKFTREPKDDSEREAASQHWLVRYLSSHLAWVWRMLATQRPIADEDLYRLIEIGKVAEGIVRCKEGVVAGHTVSSVSVNEQQELERLRKSWEGPLLDVVRRVRFPIPRHMRPRPDIGAAPAPSIVYEQQYSGMVRSAGKETIRIDFEIDGDLVTCKFCREDLEKKWKGQICEEDRVGVTTTMALVSPEGYRPTEDEIEQFRRAEDEERRIRGMKDPQED